MDIPRTPTKNRRRVVQGGVALGAVVLVTILLSSLKPAAPAVDRGVLWVDSVRRGTMVRDVRGPGTLVPEHVRYITALAPGRVDRVLAQPSQHVTAGTVLLELSNPDVQIQALQAEEALTAAQAQLLSLQASLANARLTQQGAVASMHTQYEDAKRQAAVADSLAAKNLIALNDAAKAHDQAGEMETRYRAAQEQLQIMTQTEDSQIAVQRVEVQHLRDIARYQQNVLRSLDVTAGDSGVVADLTLQLGQWVMEGTQLAKIVQPGKLKAVLQIPETQAKDVAIGQPAAIDTRNGIVPGHVIRIDPNAISGTVAVDVGLDGTAPGMRPDLSVDGTITIDRLPQVLYTGRPAYGQPNSTIGMFKLSEDGRYAYRVQVEVGRASVNSIEIRKGLFAGDSVILSDMSEWDNADRVRIKR